MFHVRWFLSARRLACAAALLLPCAAATAQFDDYAWTFAGDPSGAVSITSTQMHIVGPAFNACTTPDTFAHVTTTAVQAGTVSAHFVFDNQDGGFGWWAVEDPAYVVDGVVHLVGPGDFFSIWEDDVSFHVEAGQSFGFGVQSADCMFGPGVLDVTDFTLTPDAWQSLGGALAGTQGLPVLEGLGTLQPATAWSLSLSGAKELSPAWLIVGVAQAGLPFKGGVLVPDPLPPSAVLLLMTSAFGRINLGGPWPAGLPAGLTLYLQYWIQDPAGPLGFSASNAVSATQP